MRNIDMMQSARLFLLAPVAAATAALPAMAESYCVACYSPDAVYRCVVADAPASAPPDPRNQVQCIKQLAKSGGHARCSVERFTSVGCSGSERIISPAASALPVAPPAQADVPSREPVPPAAISGSSTKPESKNSNGPPRTVEELAKSTVETTQKGLDDVGGSVKTTTEKAGEQIEGVGSSIGQAAKKSWRCLSSLFSDC